MRGLVFSFITFLHLALAQYDEERTFADQKEYCSEEELGGSSSGSSGVGSSSGQVVVGEDGINMLYFKKVCWPPDGGEGGTDTECPSGLVQGIFLELSSASCNHNGRDLIISAELNGNPLPLGSCEEDILSRNITSTFIPWTIPPGGNTTTNDTIRSPDLSGLLEELIQRTNRTECAPFVLFLEDAPGSGNLTAVVTPDCNPGETTWSISSPNGELVVGPRPFSDIKETLTYEGFLPGECYTLHLNDTGCDGLSCDKGDGSLQLFWNNIPLVNVTEFECEISRDFCIPDPNCEGREGREDPPGSCIEGDGSDDVCDLNFDDASLVYEEYCPDANWTAPTFRPTAPSPEEECVDIDMIDVNGLTCPYYDRYPEQCGNTEADDFCVACGGGCCNGDETCPFPDAPCEDDSDFVDMEGQTCDWYAVNNARCFKQGRQDSSGRTPLQECCACQDADPETPTAAPTTVTEVITPFDPSPTPTRAPSDLVTPNPTPMPTPSPTDDISAPYCGWEADPSDTYEPDDRIQALFPWCRDVHGDLDWYHGRILAANGDGTYKIQFDDGDVEDAISWLWFSPEFEVARTSYGLWETVEVRLDGLWREAMIRVVQPGNMYSVEYLDTSEVETYVSMDNIRMLVKYSKDDFVEAQTCYWLEAVVTKVNPNGKYELQMTADQRKTNAPFEDLRKHIEWRPNIACYVNIFYEGKSYEDGLVVEYNDDTDTYNIFVTDLVSVVTLPLSDISPSSNPDEACSSG